MKECCSAVHLGALTIAVTFHEIMWRNMRQAVSFERTWCQRKAVPLTCSAYTLQEASCSQSRAGCILQHDRLGSSSHL